MDRNPESESERYAVDVVTCSGCRMTIPIEKFVEHAEFEPIGMQFTDTNLNYNMYYFNHTCPTCGSTILLPASSFLPFIKEDIPPEVFAGSAVCEGHCLTMTDLNECHNACFYAPFRRFLLKMLEDHRQKTR